MCHKDPSILYPTIPFALHNPLFFITDSLFTFLHTCSILLYHPPETPTPSLDLGETLLPSSSNITYVFFNFPCTLVCSLLSILISSTLLCVIGNPVYTHVWMHQQRSGIADKLCYPLCHCQDCFLRSSDLVDRYGVLTSPRHQLLDFGLVECLHWIFYWLECKQLLNTTIVAVVLLVTSVLSLMFAISELCWCCWCSVLLRYHWLYFWLHYIAAMSFLLMLFITSGDYIC